MRSLILSLISLFSINAIADVGCVTKDKKNGYFEVLKIKEYNGKIQSILYNREIIGQGGCTMEANSSDPGTIWSSNNMETTIKFKDSPTTLVTIKQDKEKTGISIDGESMYFCGAKMAMPEKVIINSRKGNGKCNTFEGSDRW